MASSNPFFETLAELQNATFIQALNHAKNASEDALPKDSNVKAGTSRCVHFGYPTNLHEAFESELHKTKLLKKVLSDKDKLINKRLTYTRELEHRLSKEQRQTQILRKRYEKERTHSYYLSQTLSKAHEGVMSLQAQTAGSELLKDALRKELHKRTATIKNLEEQNRQLIAILTQNLARMCESGDETSHQVLEKCVEDVSSESSDNYEESPTQVAQVIPTLRNIPATIPSTTPKPVRSILKRSSTDEPTLTTLATSAATWMRSGIKAADTRVVYFHKDECHPKPSSPEFRERVRRQLNLEQMALARQYLVSLELPNAVEESEQDAQSSTFETRKRKQEKEEQQAFAQSPMQRLKMVRVDDKISIESRP
ncbi:hypothetical protein KCU73_g10393, partial [Aureobasidium melanogenum]